MTAEQLWAAYSKTHPLVPPYEAWAFGGITPDSPNLLAKLVADGIKTATSSAYPLYALENVPLPQVGAYNIILDSDETAVCITQTTKVYTVPFAQVTAEHARKEGEGDRSLAYWRSVHTTFFTGEMASIGQPFTEEMPVVCEEFEVVYRP